ncbi:FAD-dependent oxidoreductase [Paracoccus sanguinis]|uniref:FAD-dependent oxidoreductase n=1 Tax=Paracoccus sanguinis TaxID=1545044 RepID=A0A099GNB3_9RHOB|nr:FAD-dependent oxidoreductase [Paracoccus sanguinis]
MIIGAGPTGLVLALWLSRIGVGVRIIDRTTGPGTNSRALAVQARTLELYRQLDLADAVVAQGHKVPAVNLWTKGERAARVDFSTVGTGLTRYAFLEIFPQDEHERLLIERLRAFGVVVERQTELLTFSDDGAGITARLRKPDGREETCKASYLAGCDGASSTVRKALGIGFAGGTYHDIFYVADIEGSGPTINGELHVDLDEADFLAVFPLAGTGRARLVGAISDVRLHEGEGLTFADIGTRVIEQLKIDVARVNWFSTYHVHHRIAEHFRKGRAFLLGDAGHIHSPVGGQGMNTGILDAINLAWKLAAVLSDRAGDSLLDSYEPERMGFARRLVATTDRAFSFVTADGRLASVIRTRIAPTVLSGVFAFKPAREFLFRTVSQITLNYRDMALSAGRAGDVAGGDRLPWVSIDGTDNHTDNHEPLQRTAWQVHVYGTASHALSAWCRAHDIPLHAFAWQPAYGQAGLARDALYLIRPDTYVALAEASGDPDSIDRYFAERQIRPGEDR